MQRRTRVAWAMGAVLVAMLIVAGTASAASVTRTFTGSGITIPDSGNGTPYPATVAVTGLRPPIQDVNVLLNAYSHSYPDDVGAVLIGPAGQALMLMDGATSQPTAQPAVGLNLKVDDSAPAQFPNDAALASTSYKPANYYFPLDSFPAPGPLVNYQNPGPANAGTATLASVFTGGNPNGTWSLYIRDFTSMGGQGAIGSWAVELTTPAPKCKKKKHKKHSAAAAKKCGKKKKK
jgi:subtilisin-like proprotein convertase family protein